MYPGIYKVEIGSLIVDVINLAGGFTEEADTSLINLAKQVKKMSGELSQEELEQLQVPGNN